MAGYSRMFVVGRPGGFMGAGGVNHIECLILVGDASRQWLEPKYLAPALAPLGNTKVIVPREPDDPDSLLDACIAFCPWYFTSCPSFGQVESLLANEDRLDFDARRDEIPTEWETLRREARSVFDGLHIWRADLRPLKNN